MKRKKSHLKVQGRKRKYLLKFIHHCVSLTLINSVKLELVFASESWKEKYFFVYGNTLIKETHGNKKWQNERTKKGRDKK
jgi:hypothetical protein